MNEHAKQIIVQQLQNKEGIMQMYTYNLKQDKNVYLLKPKRNLV